MKVKLICISTYLDEDYSDSYSPEIRRHFLNSFSDFEEISDKEYFVLSRFVKDYNEKLSSDIRSGKLKNLQQSYYYAIVCESDFPIKFAIQERLKEELKITEAKKEAEIKAKAQREKAAAERAERLALSKKEKLQKKLEKLKKQLEEEENKK